MDAAGGQPFHGAPRYILTGRGRSKLSPTHPRTETPMKKFVDDGGTLWEASVAEATGGDYKGRFYLTMREEDGDGAPIALPEIRWNSLRTAERTLHTMSDVELRRRLRTAVGREGLAAL